MSNHIEVGVETPVDQSFFKVREQSLHGDCQTIYNIHPLATYEAMEIEEQLETVEKQRSLKEHLQGGLSQARTICKGKKYWQITKTRDFNSCNTLGNLDVMLLIGQMIVATLVFFKCWPNCNFE